MQRRLQLDLIVLGRRLLVMLVLGKSSTRIVFARAPPLWSLCALVVPGTAAFFVGLKSLVTHVTHSRLLAAWTLEYFLFSLTPAPKSPTGPSRTPIIHTLRHPSHLRARRQCLVTPATWHTLALSSGVVVPEDINSERLIALSTLAGALVNRRPWDAIACAASLSLLMRVIAMHTATMIPVYPIRATFRAPC
ncbi:hypothetical protein FB45DRAFT_947703, partial [Roridomyces roridus]